jgi:predicted transcriptional regulator
VIGIVSDRDLQQAGLLSDSMDLIVRDVMTANPYCVQVGTRLTEVTREMAAMKYGCVVVLNDLADVVGIFTTTDGMRVLSELLAAAEPSAPSGKWTVEQFFTNSASTLV